MRRPGLILLIIICFSSFVFADRVNENFLKGKSAFEKKDFKKSAEYFKKASKSAETESPENYYNLKYDEGVSLYKLKKYDEAVKNFEESLKSENLDLQQKAYYNAANSLIKKIKSSKKHSPEIAKELDKALKYYKNAILLNNQDNDAKRNYEIALKMKKQMNKNQANNNNQNKKDKKDKNKKQENKQNKNKDNKRNKDKKKNQQNNQSQDKSEKEKKKDKKKQQSDKNKKKNNKDKKDNKQKNKSNQSQDMKQQKVKKQKQLSKKDLERMLKAMQDEEKANRKKVKIYTGQEIKTDRDW